jgi:hypothetical protein
MNDIKKPKMIIDGGLPKWNWSRDLSNSGLGFMWKDKPKLTKDPTKAWVKISCKKISKLMKETQRKRTPFRV